MDERRLRPVLLLVFAASGFAGLIYESVWTHYLKLFLGHAAYAQTLVLAIFMGGLALGAWLASRRVAGLDDPLRGYALAEGLLGTAAFLFHPLFTAATSFAYDAVLPALPPGLTAAFRWSLAAVLILPQSVALGTTFPLMAAGLLRRHPEGQGASVSLLYFANSIGGVAGVLCSGFLLVRAFGLPGTLAAAGLVNLAVAGAALAIARASRPDAASRAPVHRPPAPAPDATFRLMVGAAAVTGAASFVYEIVWIRLLTLVLGASTHAFELMLGAFILGLALGSLWVRRRIDRIGGHVRLLAAIQVLMGVLALATLPLYGETFLAVAWLLAVLPKSAAGYLLFLGASQGIALAVMLPATLCAGMTLPLIAAVLLRRGHGERSVGVAYAANTLGGIAGVFLAVHGAMPLLGLRGALLLGAALDAGLGLVLAWTPASGLRLRGRLWLTAAAMCALPLFFSLGRLDDYLLASGVYRTGALIDSRGSRIVARRDGKTSTVHVLRWGGILSLLTNGKGDAAVGIGPADPVTVDERTTVLLAALPLLMRPDAGPVANIGMGSGLTSHELLASARVSSLDTIEIEPAVAELARQFQPRNARVFTDPRSRVSIEDAKSFFATSPARYGIVVSEPSAVWVSGNASLFTREFYRQVRGRLDARGLFVQWLHLYEIGPDQVLSILKAFDETFPDWAVYLSNDYDAILVGAAAGQVPPPAWTPAAVAPFAAALARTDVLGPADLRVRRVADRRSLSPLLHLSGVPANSDFHPFVDQEAGRARFLRLQVEELSGLDHPVPAVRMLGTGLAREASPLPGSSPALDLARKARTAAVFFSEVRARPPGAPLGDLSGEAPVVAATVTRLVARCASPGPDALGAAYGVAIEVAPFLSPPETSELWETLAGWPCVQALPPAERSWVSLFRAVGELDAQAMAERGAALALADTGGRAGLARYALACALLGKVASGDAPGALALWRARRPETLPPGQQALFRLILAHAGAAP